MTNADYDFFLPEDVLPQGFEYPAAYVEHVSGPLLDITPWHFFYSDLTHHFKGLAKRYPSRVLIPFARRQDNDDMACFDLSDGPRNPHVSIIHDFASAGWEQRLSLANFEAWVELARKEAQEWEKGK